MDDQVSAEECHQARFGHVREADEEGLIIENCLLRMTGNPKIF
jgi:hypothetical protein